VALSVSVANGGSFCGSMRPRVRASDRKRVADDKHPDHQYWIDRWSIENNKVPARNAPNSDQEPQRSRGPG
jgi:hypothetical protein